MVRNRLVSIDVLRGVAALGVLINHLPFSTTLVPTSVIAGTNLPSWLPSWLSVATSYGRFGVDLFLVISGFCIHMQWARGTGQRLDFTAFWRRRLRRLYPPYFVALLLTLLGLFLLFGVVLHRRDHGLAAAFGYESDTQLVVDVLLLLILAQNVNGAFLRIGNGPFWSLALEEQLYMLYFPLLWLRQRFGWTTAMAVCVGVTLGWRVLGLLVLPGSGLPFCWTGPWLWFEWALGALAVEAYLGRVQLPAWTRSVGVGCLFGLAGVLLNLPSLSRVIPAELVADSAFGLCFFVCVNAVTEAEKNAWRPGIFARPLAHVGGWSYSLYLTHEPVLVAAKQLALRAGLGVTGVLLTRVGLALGAGYLFHVVVERRFMTRRPALAGTKPVLALGGAE